MRIIASIAHAAHVEARKPQYDRLCTALKQADIPYVTASGKAPGASWCIEQWQLGLGDASATHVLFCADDVEPCDDFGHVLRAVVASRPNDIICLGNFHDEPIIAERQNLHWLKTTDGVVGQMYLMPHPTLASMMRFKDTAACAEHIALPAGHKMIVSDDGFVNLFAMLHDLPVFATVPALYEHVEGESMFGNDDDWGRKCTVRSRPGMKDIDWSGDALDCGRTNNLHHRHMLWSVKYEYWRTYRVLERYYDPANWRATA